MKKHSHPKSSWVDSVDHSKEQHWLEVTNAWRLAHGIKPY